MDGGDRGAFKLHHRRVEGKLGHELVLITEDGAPVPFQFLLLEAVPERKIEGVRSKGGAD